MNVFELSHQVNDRLNGGDESKFSITLAIVNEILYYRKMVFSFKESVNLISRGDFDERISYIIDLENELKEMHPQPDMINELTTSIWIQGILFEPKRRVFKIISNIMKVSGTVLFLGFSFAAGCALRRS